ncbi:MAG: helix-turn-helix domain-containing protein, partial [Bacteroidales bacterium]|nr:helix-turn-helix domain-containing protein [Bacteroidales bacterium]
KSASQFIREIRLNKAMELLQHTELNVSEVSYKVGFSSPAYFNNCFHKHFGFAPGAAKNHAEVESSSVKEGSEVNSTEGKKVIRHSSKLPVAAVVIIALLGSFFAYHTLSNSQSKNDPGNTPKSIAILPLKNLSNNPEIQYIADGIMEDILTRLSYVDGLVVKSRISSEKIGNEKLTAREVAKEMDVEYFLEGSILPEDEKIRVNVQLISAKEDKHIWANHFDKDLTEILPFITEVSGQIADQLEIILSPQEKEQVEKIYTENREAYKLYLEGRFYYQLRTKENFEKSIDLYNHALTLDSGFCLAYAGLADSYVTSTWYGFLPRETGIPKSRAFAFKALKIDNNLAEAHATLGGIATYFDYDWDQAEKELKRALKINPNYMRAYKLYSEYMDIIGNREMARQYIDKALILNPNYPNLLWHSCFYYVREGRYDKALVESNKLFYLNKEEEAYYWRNFKVWLLQDRMQEAVEAYARIWNIQYPNVNANFIEKIYKDAGKEGFIDFVINTYKKITNIDDLPELALAELYALINKKDSAIICLEKSFEKEAACVRIKDDPFLRDLKTDPRFIALLRKMNLADDY